ncbi:MAG TPA: carboxylating nicotinate-nucleotide diphosphorylase [Halanaerobiales bacterium]|nr:carboxylating nicotinate-nucleotide diphosphorylase [Halanaerobiales bacterium]
MFWNKQMIKEIVQRALKEDIWTGDITSETLLEPEEESRAVMILKEDGIIAGIDLVFEVFKQLNNEICINQLIEDGQKVKSGVTIAELKGPSIDILKGERTALNFIQRMSGIATTTGKYVDEVRGLPVRITDTRKTTPGLRLLEKYAVKAGGGYNHRMGLYDAVLIKDNHLKALGGILPAIKKARENLPHTVKIEVEVEDIRAVKKALEAGVDIIMLDNMGLRKMTEAVKLIEKRALVEASGGITLENIYQVAATGVDLISVGALTHHIKALDISLNFVQE